MTKANKKKRWLKRLLLTVLVLGVGTIIMSLFYRLPDISSRQRSYMIDDGQATTLGRQFAVFAALPSIR